MWMPKRLTAVRGIRISLSIVSMRTHLATQSRMNYKGQTGTESLAVSQDGSAWYPPEETHASATESPRTAYRRQETVGAPLLAGSLHGAAEAGWSRAPALRNPRGPVSPMLSSDERSRPNSRLLKKPPSAFKASLLPRSFQCHGHALKTCCVLQRRRVEAVRPFRRRDV